MRTVVHLSDLHFGRVDEHILDPLVERVRAIAPDLVAVSGDLTQRARRGQFRAARRFLERLPRPLVVVPGNHDVPFYDVLMRFLRPLNRYRRHIEEDLAPFFADDEIAVLGINTARSLALKGGRINERQAELIRERLCHGPPELVRILVTHHPFDVPEGRDHRDVVGRAEAAMKVLAACNADVLLSGHLHMRHTAHTAERYKLEGHSALVIQAGTATSTRSRGQANSFNVLYIEHPRIEVEGLEWERGTRAFRSFRQAFAREEDGWKPAGEDGSRDRRRTTAGAGG